MSIRKRTLKGGLWSVFESFGGQILGMVFFLALAYLLQPRDFGIVAYAGVMVAVVEIILDLGLTQSLIQEETITDLHRNSAFWFLIGLGLLLTSVTVFAAQLFSHWSTNKILPNVVQVMALSLLFVNVGSVFRAELKRDLDFRSIAYSSIMSIVLAGVLGVVMAWYGYGLWSLVAREIVYDFVDMVGLVYFCDWEPDFGFSRDHLRTLMRFGWGMVGTRVAGYLRRQSDDFIIGYFLGPLALGYYSVAYRIYMAFRRLLHRTVNEVAFPAFSAIQLERDKLVEGYLTSLRISCFVAVPLFLLASVLSPELIDVFLAPKWTPTAPLLAVLCLVGMVDSFAVSTGSVLMALGHSWLKMTLNLTNALVNVVGFIIGSKWGVTGVAVSFLISQFVYQFLPLGVVKRQLQFSLDRYPNQWIRSMTACLFTAAAVVTINVYIRPRLTAVSLILFDFTFFSLLYAGIIRVIYPDVLEEVIRLGQSAFSLDG